MHWILWALLWTLLIASGLALIIRIGYRLHRRALRTRLAVGRAEAGMPEPTDRFEIVPSGKRRVPYGCGHDGPRDYVGHFYGLEMEPSPEILKSREKCPDCQIAELKPLVVRCALCGLPIFPGEPVALYAGPASAFTKAWATMVDGQFMGCLRWDCCASGAFFAGHWTIKGFCPAFGGASAAAAAFASGDMVIVGDTSDPASISMTPPPKEEEEN